MVIRSISFTINQLVASDFYVGYHVNNWNPMINYFLLGSYKNINIFNMNFTYNMWKIGMRILNSVFLKKGVVWAVNEKFFFFNKLGEFLNLKRKVKNLFFYNDKWEKGILSNYKHVIFIKRKKFPHTVFVPSVENNAFVVNEAFILKIPTIGIVDSKENPYNVMYPIGGNSKSIKSTYFSYLLLMNSAYKATIIKKQRFWRLIKKKLRKLTVNLENNLIGVEYFKKFNNSYYLYAYKSIYEFYIFLLTKNELTFAKIKEMARFLAIRGLLNVKSFFIMFKKRIKKKSKRKKYDIFLFLKSTICFYFLSASLKFNLNNILSPKSINLGLFKFFLDYYNLLSKFTRYVV